MKTCMVPPARLADWPGLAGFKRDRCSYKVSRNLFTDTEDILVNVCGDD